MRRHIVPMIVIVLGSLLSFTVFYAARSWEGANVRDAFESEISERNAVLEREILINLLVLQSLQAYCSHGSVDRDSFSNFAAPLLQQHQSIQALAYIPRVGERERAAWEAQAAGDGLRGFHITERTPQGRMRRAARRSEYFPVFYLEPNSDNRKALGFDLASDPSRRKALEQARDTGALVATAPVLMMQSKHNESGVLVVAPLYRNLSRHPSTDERRRKLSGYALGVFYHARILERAFRYFTPQGIEAGIYDVRPTGRLPIYYHHSRKLELQPGERRAALQSVRSLNVAGRQWLVVYRATSEFMAGYRHNLPPVLLGLGLLLTATLANYLVVVIRRTEVVGRLVEKRTRELLEEIAVRARAEQELRKARADLEVRVTERTEALVKSEGKYRQLFHSNPQPMWVYDLHTLAFLDVNEAAVRAYGYSREEFLTMTIKEIRPPEEVPELLATLVRMTPGLRNSGIWLHRKKDGGTISAEITVHRFEFEGREAELVLAHDVTARLRADQEKEALEVQLRQSQKMEAIGTLAGGIAHDFNNILTAIVGYSMLLKMKLAPEGPQSPYVERILAAAERAATLTKSLLAYSRKQISKPRCIDLNNIVTGVTPLLRGLIPESIEFSTALSEEGLTVMADPGQIEQVLMNLATNARDAMPEGGTLRLVTTRCGLGEDFIRRHGYGKVGCYASLEFSDSGCGMEQAICERIFEPFFTTKEVGKGTGLGLSMAYGIVKQHDGFINATSRPGLGTSFTIYLPISDGEPEPSRPVSPFQAPAKGMETLLLIEDDPEIRTPIKELLELEGYTVKLAVDGEDGILKFRQWQDSIDLVILDVVMPKMNGKGVYEEIQKLRPGTRALFISGYTDEILDGREGLPTAFTLVSKPISVHKLLKAIREAVAPLPAPEAAPDA